MSEVKSFEFEIDDRPFVMEMGKCAVALFYKKAEVDYITLNPTGEDEDIIRIFNANLARWSAGFMPIWKPKEKCWYYPTTFMGENDERIFRHEMGWSPAVILRNEPLDWEEERYILAQTQDIDKDISDFLGDR